MWKNIKNKPTTSKLRLTKPFTECIMERNHEHGIEEAINMARNVKYTHGMCVPF